MNPGTRIDYDRERPVASVPNIMALSAYHQDVVLAPPLLLELSAHFLLALHLTKWQLNGDFYLQRLDAREVQERWLRWCPRGGGLLPLGCRGRAGSPLWASLEI